MFYQLVFIVAMSTEEIYDSFNAICSIHKMKWNFRNLVPYFFLLVSGALELTQGFKNIIGYPKLMIAFMMFTYTNLFVEHTFNVILADELYKDIGGTELIDNYHLLSVIASVILLIVTIAMIMLQSQHEDVFRSDDEDTAYSIIDITFTTFATCMVCMRIDTIWNHIRFTSANQRKDSTREALLRNDAERAASFEEVDLAHHENTSDKNERVLGYLINIRLVLNITIVMFMLLCGLAFFESGDDDAESWSPYVFIELINTAFVSFATTILCLSYREDNTSICHLLSCYHTFRLTVLLDVGAIAIGIGSILNLIKTL